MTESKKVITQCARCNRAVFTIHVNADGLCVVCEPVKLANSKKDKKGGKP